MNDPPMVTHMLAIEIHNSSDAWWQHSLNADVPCLLPVVVM